MLGDIQAMFTERLSSGGEVEGGVRMEVSGSFLSSDKSGRP